MKRICPLLILLAGVPASADFEKGADLANEGHFAEAIVEFRKAADAGDGRGYFALGTSYYFGEGVEVDYDKAISSFREGAKHGSAESKFFLATMYEKGEGVERNEQVAAENYLAAAENCVPEAQIAVAKYYYLGHIVEKDPVEAAAWLLVAYWISGDRGASRGLSQVIDELTDSERSQAIGVQRQLIAKHDCRSRR